MFKKYTKIKTKGKFEKFGFSFLSEFNVVQVLIQTKLLKITYSLHYHKLLFHGTYFVACGVNNSSTTAWFHL